MSRADGQQVGYVLLANCLACAQLTVCHSQCLTSGYTNVAKSSDDPVPWKRITVILPFSGIATASAPCAYFLYLLSCKRQTEIIDSIPIVNILRTHLKLEAPLAHTHTRLQL